MTEDGNTTLRPAEGVVYTWRSGDGTDAETVWSNPLGVALNAIDYRGALPFTWRASTPKAFDAFRDDGKPMKKATKIVFD